MNTIEKRKQTTYDTIRNSVLYFLKRHKYIKQIELSDRSLLKEDLKLTKTDVHVICNHISVLYNIDLNPIETRHYETLGELLSYFNYKVQRNY